MIRKAPDGDFREARFIETVLTAGYRFIGAVDASPVTTAPVLIPGSSKSCLQPT